MKLESALPVSALFFKHWAADDTEMGVVVAKARFKRAEDGRFRVSPAAPALNYDDAFAGDPATSPLAHEQDIAPAKTATDVIIHAIARSEGSREMTDWPVSIAIADRLYHEFRVQGPSHWLRNGPVLGWQREPIARVTSVPLEYTRAYGGVLRDDTGTINDAWPQNPAGVGFVTQAWLDRQRGPYPAPQIGLLAELMTRDPLAEMSVQGTGPIAKSWSPRRALGGTFDASWLGTRHPRMPADYDLNFWNTAPRKLQSLPFLDGAETLVITGVSVSGPVSVKLPGARIGLQIGDTRDFVAAMVLNTVEVDVTAEDPGEHSIHLTWRARLSDPDSIRHATLVSLRADKPSEATP